MRSCLLRWLRNGPTSCDRQSLNNHKRVYLKRKSQENARVQATTRRQERGQAQQTTQPTKPSTASQDLTVEPTLSQAPPPHVSFPTIPSHSVSDPPPTILFFLPTVFNLQILPFPNPYLFTWFHLCHHLDWLIYQRLMNSKAQIATLTSLSSTYPHRMSNQSCQKVKRGGFAPGSPPTSRSDLG